MNLIINQKRAEMVVQRLYAAFSQRQGLLSELENLVENQIPEGVFPLSREHSLFLFFTVFNDHGMKSVRLYSLAKKLFHLQPEIFDPARVLATFTGPEDPDLLAATGRYLSVRYPKVTAANWYVNSKRLCDLYAADPRNLFSSTAKAAELLDGITQFRGYGPKTGGMLLRAVIGLGFAKVTGLEEVLLPVDIHDSRISFLTGMIRAGDKRTVSPADYYRHVPQIQRMLLDTCNTLGLSWLNVDRALWIIGSRGCVDTRCQLCPISDFCRLGQKTLKSQICRQGAPARLSCSNVEPVPIH